MGAWLALAALAAHGSADAPSGPADPAADPPAAVDECAEYFARWNMTHARNGTIFVDFIHIKKAAGHTIEL